MMATLSCWALLSNPTPGSELTIMTNYPGPADIPHPSTTMDVVVCGAGCCTVRSS